MISLHSKPDLGKGNTTFTLVSRKFKIKKKVLQFCVNYLQKKLYSCFMLTCLVMLVVIKIPVDVLWLKTKIQTLNLVNRFFIPQLIVLKALFKHADFK